MPLAITTDKDSGTILLSGRLDSHTAPDLEKALDGILAQPRLERLVFDLRRLEYLSSAGVRCFVRARKALEPAGGHVFVVNPQPPVRKVLDIIMALPYGVFESVAELDAYLDHMQRKVRDGQA